MWWRMVEAREPSPEQKAGQPGFVWCGNEFWEGSVDCLYPEAGAVGADLALMAKDNDGRRETGWTGKDFVGVPLEAFPEDEPPPRRGDRIAVRWEYFPEAVRIKADRLRSGMRHKRMRRHEADLQAFEREARTAADEADQWNGDRSAKGSGARRAYPASPTESGYQRERLNGMRWLARLFDPPTHGSNRIWRPEHYLAGMRPTNPAHVNPQAFTLVGKSAHFPQPGALLDERPFILDDEAHPRFTLDLAHITRAEAVVIRLPYHDDPNAIYRLALPAGLFRAGRPPGATTGTLTRLWVPRFEGGSFCHVKASWDKKPPAAR